VSANFGDVSNNMVSASPTETR